MAEYVLSCCSTVDLSIEHLEKRNIKYICFTYYLNEEEYKDDFGQTIPIPDFYKAMEGGASTRTSQINIADYKDYFETFLKEGKDVIHVTLSSGISGTVTSANCAADMLRPLYPDRQIIIIDSLAASSGYGLLMDRAADMRDEGMTINELEAWINANKLNVHHWFFSTTLKYYVKGGRVTRAEGFLGNALSICPLLHVDEEGRLIPMEKVRTKKRVIKAIVDKMVQYADDGLDYSGKCYLSNSACYEDAKAVADLVRETFNNKDFPIEINDIGTVIGSHTGPGTVALFFWGKSRLEK